ncbi:MAG: hypothetical protein ACHP7N_18045 [Caulobacterales bacterium]
MTTRAFNFLAIPDLTLLKRAVAKHFNVEPHQVCVYTNTFDIDPPFNDEKPGAQWAEFEASATSVYFNDSDQGHGPVCAWCSVQTRNPTENNFEDRPLARTMAAVLNQTIVFRDPVPDPRDHPIVEAAQIAVTPDGKEVEMWFVEYGENGESRNDLFRRDEL